MVIGVVEMQRYMATFGNVGANTVRGALPAPLGREIPEHQVPCRHCQECRQEVPQHGLYSTAFRINVANSLASTPQASGSLSAACFTSAEGVPCLLRYADDVVVVFATEQDASRVAGVLAKRFARFGLRLHPDKTRLIRFQRPAAVRARPDSSGRGPSTCWVSRTTGGGRRPEAGRSSAERAKTG